jgi:hypothetical protein
MALPGQEKDQMPATVIAQVNLHRQHDPLTEYRRLLLYQTGRNFQLWQVIGFVSDKATVPVGSRSQIAFGSESDMREILRKKLQELKGEGFRVMEAGPAH